jgi:hypothetical protein
MTAEGKVCTKCAEFKLFSEFSSQGIKTRADGSTYTKYRAQCKLCRKDKVQQWAKTYLVKNGDALRARNREKWRLNNPPKEPKPKRTLEEAREYQKRYYQDNKEKYKAYAKQYYQDNKEKYKDYVKKWIEENKEQHTAVRKAYEAANREKINAQQKANAAKWFAENPEKMRALRRAKKARLKAKDPQAWNEKMVKYNQPAQQRMVSELRDAYVRQRLARSNDDSPRKISAKDIPQSLVEAKRLQLMILRSLKNEKC